MVPKNYVLIYASIYLVDNDHSCVPWVGVKVRRLIIKSVLSSPCSEKPPKSRRNTLSPQKSVLGDRARRFSIHCEDHNPHKEDKCSYCITSFCVDAFALYIHLGLFSRHIPSLPFLGMSQWWAQGIKSTSLPPVHALHFGMVGCCGLVPPYRVCRGVK